VGVASGLCCSLHRVSCMPRLKPVGAAGTRSGKESGKERVGEGETEKKGDGEKVCEVIRRQQTAFSAALLAAHAGSPVSRPSRRWIEHL